MDASLFPFFEPRGVVVVGASTSPEKLGFGVARNLVASGFTGAIHFLGQKRGELFGRPVFADLAEVPDPVDLAILIVPPNAAADTIAACGRRGIGAAVIVSAGFREVGPQGAALEQRCVETARHHGVRLLGPNCIGTIDTHLPLDTTFIQPPMPARGGIGFISHSGAFCAAIVDWSRGQGFGFSRIVSLGNQADVNETDVLPMLAADENTRVIVLYMEGVSDGQRFVRVGAEVVRQKPVIALKVGRMQAGQKAAASHTGALAASDTAFDAAFARAGILRADSSEQMFDWARAFEPGVPLAGDRIAILTNAGGPGVIAADALELNGLQLSELSDRTQRTLAEVLPPSASLRNPVDMLASASPEVYGTCLKILLEDPAVDGVMVILPPPPMYTAEDVASKLIEVSRKFDKPVVVALLGSTLIEKAGALLQGAGIPAYPFPERAASAFGALAVRARHLTTALPSLVAGEPPHPPAPVGALPADELIAAYGIRTNPLKLARDSAEAASIAKEIGFPVVMKIASPEIAHKSDIGGVLLGIQNAAGASDGYTILMDRAHRHNPQARIEGVHIQRQVQGGQEVIVGAVRDPQFGHMMMFGSGGVEVEGLRDVAFALAPLDHAAAQGLIRDTWAGRKLAGYRNFPAVDEAAAIEALVKLSKLVRDQPAIEEIEINPLVVSDHGAIALDVRMKINPQ